MFFFAQVMLCLFDLIETLSGLVHNISKLVCHHSQLDMLVLEQFIHIGPGVYPKGSLVIALVRPSVCPCVGVSIFKYPRDRSLVFSSFLHEVRAP